MEKANGFKAFIAGIGTLLSAKLGLLWIVLPLFMLVIVLDYVTGMIAAKKEKKISSKTGMWEIVKKLLYGVEIAVAMSVDWTIINVANSVGFKFPAVTIFGLLVTIWIIINELISILENLTRLEVPMPVFLLKVVSNFKIAVEANGDKLAEQINTGKQE